MARQHQYRVTFYDQQGTCHQVELSTVYQIRRDPQCDLCLFDTDQCVGSEEMLERMIRQKTGLEQEISIINAPAHLSRFRPERDGICPDRRWPRR